jgi:hypothetical protein
MPVPSVNNPNALFTLVSATRTQAAPETLIDVALFVWYDPDPLLSLKRALDAL